MASSGIYVDANLLVLLVAGLTRRGLISKHKRLGGYTVDDYDLLVRILKPAGSVFVTPNTVTEASNLLGQHGEPERSELMTTLGKLIEESPETVIPSKEASSDNRFVRLGLTDTALLKAVSPKTPLLTVDLDLFLAASAQSGETAINFNHHRFPSVPSHPNMRVWLRGIFGSWRGATTQCGRPHTRRSNEVQGAKRPADTRRFGCDGALVRDFPGLAKRRLRIDAPPNAVRSRSVNSNSTFGGRIFRFFKVHPPSESPRRPIFSRIPLIWRTFAVETSIPYQGIKA